PFYLLANLAVGGAFTDAYNLGDPGSGAPVSMPFPAEMYVDYIRVYEWNGQGDVHVGPPTNEIGSLGIYTDNTPTTNQLVPGVTEEIYVWEGTLTDGTVPPFEGPNGITWQTTGLGWFGAGIMALQPVNLFDFGAGHLKFRIKIPGNITFKIGIIDAWGNQSYVSFPGNTTTYGLVRDGNWGQACIPVADIRGQFIDLRMMAYTFVILEENGVACDFGLDDIYWDSGITTGVGDDPFVAGSELGLLSSPNPFRQSTEIRFELPEPEAYQVSIFDISGRKIVSFQGEGFAGNNSVRWDGRNRNGELVNAGVYYYRLGAGKLSSTQRVLLLK
ncbi:MAG: T9SS type A sorting domain-containing protein, partial [Candidatus Eisenbacteria bacterium]|nr:T9SS type A sorting domain-containing protein [Candidatus Eisenbacteria bacterium]